MEPTRDRVLKAAAAVIRRNGVRALTLEAVAREAGVSKGGLLYHFPSKRALIEAMAEARLADFDAAMDRHAEKHPAAGPVSRYLASLDDGPNHMDTALLAAASEDPEVLDPYRRAFATFQERLRTSSGDSVLATVARLACDGLWLGEMFGLDVLEPGERAAVVARLTDLAADADATDGGGGGAHTASAP